MLNDFVSRFELSADSIDIQFEKFLNYCLLNEDYYDSFDFDKVATGKCLGIDGLAIALGGVIVDDLKAAEAFTKAQFEVEFIFVQAKTSRKFNFGDFLKFISTVKIFFGEDNSAIPPELKTPYEIKNLIYSRASKLRNLPKLKVVYGYTGEFDLAETGLEPQIDSEIQQIRDIPYKFSEVSWRVYDGGEIEDLYREAHNEILHKISFQRHIALPTINGVKSTYLGVIKCIDFVSLITKHNGEINKGLFVGNVRDFLGARNPVNSEIERTLNTSDEKERFAILNNGVTIVAKKVTPSGDTFELSQFQIVNGCQTSHVLFNNSSLLNDEMYLSVKLIETSDLDISGSIIATTNSQSQVTKEALATIRPYHRRLEDFFNAMRSTGYEYYYERRPHQYDDYSGITQKQIVSAPGLIKSYISVVLEEPHKVHYYYGQLLQEYNKNEGSELFSEDDHPGLYFLSHHIASKIKEKVDRNRGLRNWLFHLALLIKKQTASRLKKGKAISDKSFLEILKDIDAEFDDAYSRAASIIQGARLEPNANRLPGTTKSLIKNLMASGTTRNPTIVNKKPMDKEPSFADGQYIGIVSAINGQSNICQLNYGPYALSAAVDEEFRGKLAVGYRVAFNMKSGSAANVRVIR